MIKRLSILFGLLWCMGALAAEVLPPKPDAYFNDYAHVTSAATASQLNHTLADFERQTSSQIVVAIFPKMQSDSSIDDYAVRVARSWQVGQKDKNNGAVLFVFVDDHKMTIQTGYGLEGALPDITCKRIISDEIAPHLRQGDYNGGLTAGVTAMIAATKGEYKGTGRTVAQNNFPQGGNSHDSHASWMAVVFFIIIALIIFVPVFSQRRRGGGFLTGFLLGSSGFGGWSGGGGSGGGGWSGGGGGGGGDSFSGGGGSFGGGGASGSW